VRPALLHTRGVTLSRPWDVLLVGGASGSGKTTLALELGRRTGVNVAHLDDVQAALEAVTTPREQPLLHFWRTDWPEFSAFSDEEHIAHFIELSRILFAPIVEAIVGDRLATGEPAIVEGDFILPEFGARRQFAGQPARGRVAAVFVCEEDETQLRTSIGGREGWDDAALPARTSRLKSEWLRHQCETLAVPWVSSRPWASAADRAAAALRARHRAARGSTAQAEPNQ
jgi:2-phosphoglycerate kinase